MLAASSNCTTTCARGRAASCRNTSGRVIFAFVGGVGEIRSFFIWLRRPGACCRHTCRDAAAEAAEGEGKCQTAKGGADDPVGEGT